MTAEPSPLSQKDWNPYDCCKANDYSNELSYIISDCNAYEKRVIYETVVLLKKTLRDNIKLLPKDEE